MYTAYKHGLRASEIGILQRTDVDFERLEIRITRLKGSKSRKYPLDSKTARVIKAYFKDRSDESPILFLSRNNNPISRTAVYRMFRKHATTAGLPQSKRNFKILKHSIGTHLLDARSDITFVQWWLGHVNIQNTKVYADLSNPTAHQEARRVFASSQVV